MPPKYYVKERLVFWYVAPCSLVGRYQRLEGLEIFREQLSDYTLSHTQRK